MNYLQVDFQLDSNQQEILIAYLSQLQFDSFEQNEQILKAFIEESNFDKSTLDSLLSELNISDYQLSVLENKNWNEEWEKNFPDTKIGDQIHVRATFHDKDPTIKTEIVIEPKMSFGAGNHATTYQVMEAMLDIDFNQKSVFDIGSGTGILAILAEKFGAKEILAIDHDEWCVTNMHENKSLNYSSIEIEACNLLIEGDLDKVIKDKKFDIILANLNRNLLDATFPQIKSLLNKNSILITSGYYVTDADHIEQQVNNALGLSKVNQLVKKNWTVNVFK